MSGPQVGGSGMPGRMAPVFTVLLGVAIVAGAALATGTLQESAATPSPVLQTSETPIPVTGLSATTYSCGGTTVTPSSISADAGALSTPSPVSTPSGVAGQTPPATANAPTASLPGPGDPTVALAGVVSRYPSILPASGWTPQAGSSQGMVYVAPSTMTPAPFAFVDLGLVGGKWIANAYGDCEPAVANSVTDSSLVSIPWKVPGTVDKAATTLKILFESNLCGKAFVGTTVWYGRSNVTLTLWARSDAASVRGAGSCSTTFAMSPFTVALAEGIGSRQVRIGPASAAKPASGAP